MKVVKIRKSRAELLSDRNAAIESLKQAGLTFEGMKVVAMELQMKLLLRCALDGCRYKNAEASICDFCGKPRISVVVMGESPIATVARSLAAGLSIERFLSGRPLAP